MEESLDCQCVAHIKPLGNKFFAVANFLSETFQYPLNSKLLTDNQSYTTHSILHNPTASQSGYSNISDWVSKLRSPLVV